MAGPSGHSPYRSIAGAAGPYAAPAPPPAPPPPPLPSVPAAREAGQRGVALLLAAAAVAAAIVGTRVSLIAGEASGSWQSAVRLEVKRSTGLQENVRYLYGVEVPLALTILETRTALARLESLTPAQGGNSSAVTIEKSVLTEILKVLDKGSDLTGADYALSDGGVDLGKRLAELRSETPAILAIDPDATQARGDNLARKAGIMSIALIPFGLCALLGAMAQAFAARRRRLLEYGVAVLVSGVAMAAAVEVLL
jgi:hypothetical protein